MRVSTAVLGGAVLASLAVAPAAQAGQEQERQAEQQVSDAAVLEMIEQLGAESYRERLEAEETLVRFGERALGALRDAAENHDDPEVRWRARRLARRLQEGTAGELRARDSRELLEPRTGRPLPGLRWQSGLPDLDRVFEEMFGRLERDFGLDIPRGRFFEDDFFKGLDEQMQDVRRRMEDSLRGQAFGPGWGFDSQSQSVSVKIGPDGVRLEISRRNDEGEAETEVYEAPDLETFREKYPEIAEDYLRGSGARAFTLLPGARNRLRLLPPGPRGGAGLAPRVLEIDPADPVVPAPPPPEGRRLGVLVTPTPVDVSRYLGLEAGQGLLVEEVEADGLAESLGIRRGDIVLQIGGVEIRGVDDVQRALGAIEAGERVEVTVNRRGEAVQLQAEKRKSADGGLEARGVLRAPRDR